MASGTRSRSSSLAKAVGTGDDPFLAALGGQYVVCEEDFSTSPLHPGTRPPCTADRTRCLETGNAVAERAGTRGSARGMSWNVAQGAGGAGERTADYAPPRQRHLRARPRHGHTPYV